MTTSTPPREVSEKELTAWINAADPMADACTVRSCLAAAGEQCVDTFGDELRTEPHMTRVMHARADRVERLRSYVADILAAEQRRNTCMHTEAEGCTGHGDF